MAGRACRSCRDIRRHLRPLSDLHIPSNASTSSYRASFEAAKVTRRRLHQSPNCRNDETNESWGSKLKDAIGGAMRRTTQPYQIFGATETIYKACAQPAAYTISKEDRRNGTVQTLESGEEIGEGGGMWHDDFKLLPTFSTWSQVTMLHMYLIVVRLRCLDRETYQQWQQQLVNHFFNDAEEKMDVVHNVYSRSIRQRYLKDLFTTWRGNVLAYDEGLAKGDAVLAAAVWRNIFRASEDVDLRTLAAIVSWMRLCLKNLDQMQDAALLYHGASVFKWPVKSELALVDRPSKFLEGALAEKMPGSTSPKRTA